MEWFKHDTDAHDDIKIRKLIRMHGIQAYGLYWYLVELMYRNDGQMNRNNIEDECLLAGMQEEDLPDLMDSFLDLELFEEISGTRTWTNRRVIAGLAEANTLREKMRELGKRSGEKRQRIVNDTLTARQRHVNGSLNEKREDKNRRDYNVSKDYQEECQSIKKKSKTDQTDIVCPEPSENEGLKADDPVFLTIISNKKEEVPVTESFVKMLEETYPAVDVRSELRSMKAWCISNPSNRKTRGGMKAFINNWLKRDQDRIRRIPQHNMETIRNSNIEMSLTANGSNPDAYKNERFEDYD